MIDRSIATLLQVEMTRTLQASTLYTTRKANEMVEQLRHDDPSSRVPPLLTAADETDMAKSRMESLGAHLGGGLAERCVASRSRRLTQDRARVHDALDMVKFVCKDLWAVMWQKQVDNLRTNHRGVFVLQDNAFRPLLGLEPGSLYAAMQLAFAAGVIEGALRRLGVQAHIHTDAGGAPQCAFHVRIT